MRSAIILLGSTLIAIGLFGAPAAALAQKKAAPTKEANTESDYYRLITFPLPDDVVLETSGLDWEDRQKTKLLVCTRRGELWRLENVYADAPALPSVKKSAPDKKGQTTKAVDAPADASIVRFHRLLSGLHEPLGVHVQADGIYMAQRGELTRVTLDKKANAAELVEAFCRDWEIGGQYHEYAFGPKVDNDGNLWVTLNRPFGANPEGTGYWRSWAVKVDRKGKMHPVCLGLRSPAGLGMNRDGEMFYTDNQGDHCAVGKLGHLKPGVFHGNPEGLRSLDHPLANFKLPFKGYPKLGLLWPDAVKENPGLQAPAVWLPYPEMGNSQTDVLCDTTGGKFGPFDGQLFVGDLTQGIVMRVVLEKVAGEYQGACIPFRKSIPGPVLRMCWGNDGSMFLGGTNRGWGGVGRSHGLHRLVWTGKTPFEIHDIKATPDGFRLTFTEPVDKETAANVKSYAAKHWSYNYYNNYGDKQQNLADLTVAKATVAADGRSVDLAISGRLPGYVNELRLNGLRNTDSVPLLHPIAYYTLNSIPQAK